MSASRTVIPYSRLASTYDAALGDRFFAGLRHAFEKLVRSYGISFRSAADLGCGTGIFARYVSKSRQIRVFAVDRSPEMLQEAMRNCLDSKVSLLRQDIRCLQLPCPVDLVTANFDTMNHLLSRRDLQLAFRRIFESLNPTGHFIFDVLTPCLPKQRVRVCLQRGAMGCQALQEIRWNPLRRLLSTSVTIRPISEEKPIVEVHRERAYSPAEIVNGLREVGFFIKGIHDAGTLRMADKCPARIIVVAQKLRQ